MKTCNKCKILKELEDFAKDKTTKDKRTCICKKCHIEYKKSRKRQEIVAFDFLS